MLLRKQVRARVFYSNFLRSGSTTYSGTPDLGFEAVNAYDWRDFSFFAPVSGDSTLENTPASQPMIDSAVVWRAIAGGTISALRLQVETAPSVWSTIHDFGSPAIGMTLVRFTGVTPGAGRKLRWQFVGVSGEVLFRQLFAGPTVEMATGQHVGITPPTLLQGVVVDNVISVNGSIIGRNQRRLERRMQISLEHLPPSWVRKEWQEFANHMVRFPCFLQWSPISHPSEVVLAAAEDIVAPENSTPVPLMKVSMPLRCLAG